NDAPGLIMDLPELTTEEDTSVWINLSGYGEDAEGDTFFWNSSAAQNAALAWDVERINLTVIPDADFFGVIEVELELSDGVNWTNPVLIVNVTPVNDAPTGIIVWPNGTEVGSVVEDVDGVNVTVISVELLEDSSISFSIVGTDVDGDDMLYLPEPIGADLGTLNVETYTYINETNESVTGTVPYNFTYVPEPDVNGEDIVMFLIHDGLVNGTLYVKFDIIPVNDEPILDMTDPLTVNVDIGVPQTVEISEYVSDVDGVETLTLTISDSEYATVVNLSIILDYPDTYSGSGETLTVTISDGEYTVTGEIVVAVHGDSIDDWEVTNVKVKASEDGWTVTAQGDEGQELFLV
ncbi:MAG: hypothetical protein KAH57_01760, partial [Thermoplasmata archaeon]|nr:hypothetical protein [Thermoplasmata archaeon]